MEIVQSLLNKEQFVATTSNIGANVAVAGTLHHVVTFNNPAGSGFNIVLSEILFFASGSTPMIPTGAFIVVDTTSLVTANIASPNSLFIGSGAVDTTTAIGYNFSTTALAGTQLPFELPDSNGDNILTVPFALAPGHSIGIDLSKSVALGIINSGYFMIYYLKIPV